MNISLLISGNLTGFGRFYTSPAAKELLGADKIDLDNHNHISFLGDNEKAYSITFAQRFIAISLYTRILDSFRRPGELVVTLLIPRNQIIVPNSGSPIGAVYSLLNKVCDKFFEKNFQDGMINQNPVVLGQDYYSEILDNYRLKPMNMREVNSNPSSVKKVGYVKAQEYDIPKYLDTPCRENYNDHNLIIIAQSAPAEIDEEPEEVILYSIHIKNNGATLPGRVKLTSPIYKYQAQAGEKPFPIQGTYKDAVEHLLEPRITACLLPNDVVEISYNFEKEEKTVNFIFLDKNTGTPVSIDVVQPSVVIDGTKLPISSETFTFRGAEIYASKKLVSDNSNYTISKRSEILDLSRIGNNQDLKVYVEQGFVLPMNFNKPYDVRKSVVFINKLNGQTESVEVTDRKNIHLSGSAADWEFYISSDTYCAPQQPLRVINGQWIISNIVKKKTNVSTPQVSTTVSNGNHTVAVQKSGNGHDNPSISLTGEGTSTSNPLRKRKSNYKKLAMLIIPFLCILTVGVGYLGYANGWWWSSQESNNNGEGDEGTELYAYGAYICYYDNTENPEQIDTLSVLLKDKLLIEYYIGDGSDDKLDESRFKIESLSFRGNKEDLFLHKFTNVDRDNPYTDFAVRISYEYNGLTYSIGEYPVTINKTSDEASIDTIGIKMDFPMSQLKVFEDLAKITQFESEDAKKKFEDDKINIDKGNETLKQLQRDICKRIPVKANNNQNDPKKQGDRENSLPLANLSKTDFNFADLPKYEPYKNQTIDGIKVADRIEALTVVKNSLNAKSGATRPSVDNLSKIQKQAIGQIFNKRRNPNTIKNITKGQKFKSILECENFVNKEMEQ